MCCSFYQGHCELISRRPCLPLPTNYLLRANRSNGSTRGKQFSIKPPEIEFGRRYNKVIFFISFSFISYACMFCAYSKQPSLWLRLLQFVHFRDRKREREELSQNFLTSEHFLSVLHFLFGLLISSDSRSSTHTHTHTHTHSDT